LISSIGTPMSLGQAAPPSPARCGTEPTVLMLLARLSAQQFIAIGLTYCRKVTSGQQFFHVAVMSRKTGIVRSPRMMPPMPSVSAMVWRRPYFLGISKSMTVLGL
jgi:hypothetical protein